MNYCPAKPYKYGIKLWELVAKNLNWLVAFHVAAGQGDVFASETDEEKATWPFAERVVLWGLKQISSVHSSL